MYIDLNVEVKTNAEFRYKLNQITQDIHRLSRLDGEDPYASDKIGERIVDIFRLCKYNAGLLVPYMFPSYPFNKPLSCSARPYTYSMFHMQIGGSSAYRAARQVGKSSSFAARQLIYSHIIPKYRSMYIVPHPSFLDTYANRMREMERAFRFYQSYPDHRQNLKYKEYPNGSVVYLVKCLTDTQEARSKTAGELLWDECYGNYSKVGICEGEYIFAKRISELLVGEKALAYDMNGRITPAVIKQIKNKGVKNVWKLKFSNGAELTCTGNTKFWTSNGWMYLCDFLSWEEAARGETTLQAKTLLAIREAATPGDSSWRRVHELGKELCRPYISQSLRSAESLLPEQSRSSSRLHKYTCEDVQEPRMGRGTISILDSNYSSIQFYSSDSVYTESRKHGEVVEDSNSRLAESADLGRNIMVVPGRRDTELCGRHNDKHTFISAGSGTATCGYADGTRSALESTASKEKRESILHGDSRSGFYEEIRLEDRTLYTRVDDVQNRSERPDILNMRTLSGNIFKTSRTESGTPDMCQSQLPSGYKAFTASGICGENRAGSYIPEGSSERSHVSGEAKDTYGREAGGEEGRRKCLLQEMARRPSGCGKCAGSGTEEEQNSRTIGKGARVREKYNEGPSTESKEIRTAESAETGLGAIQPVSLISIEYAGQEEVWDIETEEHHTFFAEGIAVHNCQLMDPDFLPDVEQCQKAMPMPSTIYAGTSTTMESLLECKYQASSQATWLLQAPGYVSDTVGKNWLDCGNKNDVLKAIKPMGLTNPATGQVINVADGRFVHANTARFDMGYLGFHIPQIIIPDYANVPQKWMEIFNAFETYDIKKFMQEVLGIPTEEGMREITLADLKRMCCLPETPETLRELCQGSGRYKYVVSGCDWGGSDYNPASKTKVSYTVHVILGVCWDGTMEIVHMRQYSGMDYRSIANDICEVHKNHNAVGIASDFGVGAAYNMLLRENPAIQPERHLIFNYSGPQTALVKAPESGGWFNQYALNKTESITTLYQAVRERRLKCYDWGIAQDRLLEFLNLFRVPTESPGGNALFKYQRHGSKADDTLHAVNFAYCLARIILNEPIVEDPTLRRVFQSTFTPGSAEVRFLHPRHGWDMGGVISG